MCMCVMFILCIKDAFEGVRRFVGDTSSVCDWRLGGWQFSSCLSFRTIQRVGLIVWQPHTHASILSVLCLPPTPRLFFKFTTQFSTLSHMKNTGGDRRRIKIYIVQGMCSQCSTHLSNPHHTLLSPPQISHSEESRATARLSHLTHFLDSSSSFIFFFFFPK